jgi:hypothetical protein
MPDIPSYNDWMKYTALGIMSPRSTQLKAVDTALPDYWNTPAGVARRPKRRALGDALANWIGTKGPKWRDRERNKAPMHIVEQLYNALNTYYIDEDDVKAFAAQDEMRRKRLHDLFCGKEIVWKALNPAKDAKEVYAELKRGRTPSKDAADIKKGLAKETARRATYEPGKWT